MTKTLPRFYYFANAMLRHVLFPVTRVQVKVTGLENVPLEGPLIIVFNHLTNLDAPMIGTFVPRDIEMMSKVEHFEMSVIRRWIVTNYGAFPVRRGAGDVGAIRHAMKVLKEGRALLMSPEGTRSRTSQLGEPQEGVALLAVRSRSPILPIGVSGVDQFFDRVKRWSPTPAHLSIGRPFRLVSPTEKPNRAHLDQMSEAIMERIAAEIPESYRGRFQPPLVPSPWVQELETNVTSEPLLA